MGIDNMAQQFITYGGSTGNIYSQAMKKILKYYNSTMSTQVQLLLKEQLHDVLLSTNSNDSSIGIITRFMDHFTNMMKFIVSELGTL